MFKLKNLKQRAAAIMVIFAVSIGTITYALLFSPELLATIHTGWNMLFTWNIQEIIAESMPLFFSNGYFDFNTSWSYMGITFYTTLAGIGWLAYRYYKKRNAVDIILLVWTVITLLLMLSARRFHYYFGINAAVISSYVIYQLVKYVGVNKSRMVKMLVIFGVITVLPLLRGSIVQAQNCNTYIPVHVQDCIEWLKPYGDYQAYKTGEKTEFGVFTSTNYGYWIVEEAKVPVYATPGSHTGLGYYNIIMSEDDVLAWERLKNNEMRYVIVDEAMAVEQQYMNISQSGYSDVNYQQTLLYKLYNEVPVSGFELVHENELAKIYEVK